MGTVEYEVECAAGAVGDVADAALVVEDNFVGDDLLVLDDEAVEFLRGESSGEEVVLPVGELVALVEFDAADSDGGGPVVAWGLEFGGLGAIGQGGAVIVHAVADDGPAVVAAALDVVDFVASAGTVLALPDVAGGGMGDESLGVAVTEGPDGGAGIGLLDERVVAGDASVVVDAVDFTVGECGILGFVLGAAVAYAEVEVAVLKDEACAEVDSGGTVLGKGGFEEGLVIGPTVVANAPANDFGHALGFAVAFFAAGGVAEVDPAVAVIVGVRGNFE